MIGPRTLSQLESNIGAVTVGLSQEQLDRLDRVSALDVTPTPTTRRTKPSEGDVA